jgi:hypothetical protein
MLRRNKWVQRGRASHRPALGYFELRNSFEDDDENEDDYEKAESRGVKPPRTESGVKPPHSKVGHEPLGAAKEGAAGCGQPALPAEARIEDDCELTVL